MSSVEFVNRQLGPPASLLPPVDLHWLVRELSLIQEASRRLAEIEKGPLDFPAIHFVPNERG